MRVALDKPTKFSIEKLLVSPFLKDAYVYSDHLNKRVRWLNYNDIHGLYKPNTERSPNNWIRMLGFEFNKQEELTAFHTADASVGMITTQLIKDSLERNALEEFLEKEKELTRENLNILQSQNPIIYSETYTDTSDQIIGLNQKSYGVAHGPRGNISYMGTSSIGPCVGIAFVTKIDGEEFPYVRLGHIDSMTAIQDSISKMYYEAPSNKGVTSVSIITGNRQDSILNEIIDGLSSYKLKPQISLNSSGVEQLVVDLKTGNLVKPDSLKSSTWLVPNFAKVNVLMMQCMMPTKQILRKEFDLQHGIPAGFEIEARVKKNHADLNHTHLFAMLGLNTKMRMPKAQDLPRAPDLPLF